MLTEQQNIVIFCTVILYRRVYLLRVCRVYARYCALLYYRVSHAARTKIKRGERADRGQCTAATLKISMTDNVQNAKRINRQRWKAIFMHSALPVERGGGSQRSHNSVQRAISEIYGAATPAYFRISPETGGYCRRCITRARRTTSAATISPTIQPQDRLICSVAIFAMRVLLNDV